MVLQKEKMSKPKCVVCTDVELETETKTVSDKWDAYEEETGYLYCPGCGLVYKNVKENKSRQSTGPR